MYGLELLTKTHLEEQTLFPFMPHRHASPWVVCARSHTLPCWLPPHAHPTSGHPKSLKPRPQSAATGPRNSRALPAARPHTTKPRRAGRDRTMDCSGQPRFHHPSLSPRDENRWNTQMKTARSFIGPCAGKGERLVPWPSSTLPSSGLRHSQSSQSCRTSHSAEPRCGPPRLSRPP